MVHALILLLLIAGSAQAQDAGALRARHAALQGQLADNPFGRPLHVESSASGGAHKGEIYAVIEQPYSIVALALARPEGWCQILTLQVNIKRCSADQSGQAVAAFITRKPRDAIESAHRVDFRYEPTTKSGDYLRVALSASAGPMGTHDYQIVLEAAPLNARHTFMHMSYAYTLGSVARLAMKSYLAGAGRDKRGFSVNGGERGVVERSAMRYYLAVEAYLDSLGAPAKQRLEARLRNWYAAISLYPQLHEEVGAEEYVEMKHREARPAAPGGAPGPGAHFLIPRGQSLPSV
jgi:hypothetical protein